MARPAPRRSIRSRLPFRLQILSLDIGMDDLPDQGSAQILQFAGPGPCSLLNGLLRPRHYAPGVGSPYDLDDFAGCRRDSRPRLPHPARCPSRSVLMMGTRALPARSAASPNQCQTATCLEMDKIRSSLWHGNGRKISRPRSGVGTTRNSGRKTAATACLAASFEPPPAPLIKSVRLLIF